MQSKKNTCISSAYMRRSVSTSVVPLRLWLFSQQLKSSKPSVIRHIRIGWGRRKHCGGNLSTAFTSGGPSFLICKMTGGVQMFCNFFFPPPRFSNQIGNEKHVHGTLRTMLVLFKPSLQFSSGRGERACISQDCPGYGLEHPTEVFPESSTKSCALSLKLYVNVMWCFVIYLHLLWTAL